MAPTDPAPRDRLGLLRLFALPGYRGTWIAGSIVSGVRWLEILAASVFVFQITASPFAVSMVMLARLAPNAALGGLIGSLATMFRRETLMAIGFVSLGLTRFLLAGLVIFNAIEIWHVLVGMFITGILDCSEYPIRRSLQGDYVPPDQVHRALAFDQFSNVFTMMMGPIAGGLLLDYIGLHGAYLVGASLNAVGATIALRLPTPPNNRPLVRTSIVSNLRDGFHYIRSQHFLIGVLAVTVIFNVFVWPFTTMVPVFGREQLGLSAGLIGALMAMLGAGSFIANLTLSVIRIQIVAQAYFFGTLIGTIGILALPWMTTFESALVVMLFTGIGVGCFSSNQGATMFLNASPQYRSQAMGFLTMAIGVGPLGILHIGILAAIFGAPTAMIIMAIEGMIVIGIAFFVWPDFRRFPGRPLGPEGS